MVEVVEDHFIASIAINNKQAQPAEKLLRANKSFKEVHTVLDHQHRKLAAYNSTDAQAVTGHR